MVIDYVSIFMIYTLGHSTRPLKEFLDILRHYKINYLIDVRRWPKSTYNPQYNRENLELVLSENKINYLWLGQELGGYRGLKNLDQAKHRAGQCLKSAGFKNYATYLSTDSFNQGLKKLLKLASKHQVAIMCAELLYWKCHRSIISDKLKSLGQEVIHIIDQDHNYKHKYTKCAKIENGQLTYE